MKITFYGASGEVTGSCYHVEFNDGTQVLVDSGYFQGHQKDLKRNANKLPVDWKKITHLVLTHGHLDHCGRIPVFYHQGFRGKIISTAPTKDIAEIVWQDNLKLLIHAENLSKTDPFFTQEDIDGSLALFQTTEYQKQISLSPKVTVMLVDAGHILGSSTAKFTEGADTLVFSGDLGNWPMGNVKITVHPGAADTVVMEGTYGDRTHEDKAQQKKILKDAISEIIENKSTMLIPAFAIERSQELLRDLDDMFESGELPQVATFLDSPMAIKVTALFGKYRNFLNDEVRRQYEEGDDPYSFKTFKVTETTQDSKEINNVPGPKIVIAGSGMMTGGRVIHHLKRVLPDPRNILLVVGYQAEGTMGREIQSGRRSVEIEGRQVPVRCQQLRIEAYSAHADKNQLLEWLGKFDPHPRNVILTHCDCDASSAFADAIRTKIGVNPQIPKLNETIEV